MLDTTMRKQTQTSAALIYTTGVTTNRTESNKQNINPYDNFIFSDKIWKKIISSCFYLSLWLWFSCVWKVWLAHVKEIFHFYSNGILKTTQNWYSIAAPNGCLTGSYLMFLWQVEFWLAKHLLLTLHGSRAVYFIRHRKSIITLTYCLCCVFHSHCSRRHTYGTENQ